MEYHSVPQELCSDAVRRRREICFAPAGDLQACWKLRPAKQEKKEAASERKTHLDIGRHRTAHCGSDCNVYHHSACKCRRCFCKIIYELLTFSVDFDILENIWSNLGLLLNIAVVFCKLCYGLFTYGTEPGNIEKMKKLAAPDEANLDTYIAITVIGIMCAYLPAVFRRADFWPVSWTVNASRGYTYAAYARRGFF